MLRGYTESFACSPFLVVEYFPYFGLMLIAEYVLTLSKCKLLFFLTLNKF